MSGIQPLQDGGYNDDPLWAGNLRGQSYDDLGTDETPTVSGSTTTKTGSGIINNSIGSGVDAFIKINTGAGITDFDAFAARAGVHLGSGIVNNSIGSGAKARTDVNTGAGVVNNAIGSGARTTTRTKTGAGITGNSIGSGSKLITRQKTGAGISDFNVLAVEARVHKIATSIVVVYFIGGGSKSVLHVKTGGAVTAFVGAGFALQTRMRYFPTDTVLPVYPLTTITGICRNPYLGNVRTGETFSFYNLDLGAGDVLIIDHNARTVRKNGVFAYSYSGRFFALDSADVVEVGAQAIGAGFSVYLTVPRVGGHHTRTQHGGAVSPRVGSGVKA